jgi:hypothetical protein
VLPAHAPDALNEYLKIRRNDIDNRPYVTYLDNSKARMLAVEAVARQRNVSGCDALLSAETSARCQCALCLGGMSHDLRVHPPPIMHIGQAAGLDKEYAYVC